MGSDINYTVDTGRGTLPEMTVHTGTSPQRPGLGGKCREACRRCITSQRKESFLCAEGAVTMVTTKSWPNPRAVA